MRYYVARKVTGFALAMTGGANEARLWQGTFFGVKYAATVDLFVCFGVWLLRVRCLGDFCANEYYRRSITEISGD